MPTRHQAAERVALLINEAERAMDIAMAKTSALVTELPSLQMDAGLNASWAQPVVAAVCSALGDMTTARGSIIGAHRSLSAIKRKLGIAILESPNNPKEDDEHFAPTGRAETVSRVVPLRA